MLSNQCGAEKAKREKKKKKRVEKRKGDGWLSYMSTVEAEPDSWRATEPTLELHRVDTVLRTPICCACRTHILILRAKDSIVTMKRVFKGRKW